MDYKEKSKFINAEEISRVLKRLAHQILEKNPNAGELALVHRVGYTSQSRSHFDSQHYWETGIPRDDGVDDGIFYRSLVALGLDQTQNLPGISYNSTMPLLLRGEIPMTNVDTPSRFDLLGIVGDRRFVPRHEQPRYHIGTARHATRDHDSRLLLTCCLAV